MCGRKCWIVSFFTFFCTFPIGNFPSEGRFWTTTLPHHTPPPIPKLSSITKTRILFVFFPKKCPSFACTFTKMSLSEGFGTLPFQTFLWTLPSDSYWLMLPPHIKAHQFSGEIPAENFPCTLGGKKWPCHSLSEWVDHFWFQRLQCTTELLVHENMCVRECAKIKVKKTNKC